MRENCENFKQVTIRLNADLWKKLKIMAVESGMFVNTLVVKDLEKLVNRYKDNNRRLS